MQFTYNITTLVPEEIEEEWVKWIVEIHLKEILDTGLILQHYLYKLRDKNVQEGVTYTLQIFFKHLQDYEKFKTLYEQKLLEKRKENWGNACLSFISSMEVIH